MIKRERRARGVNELWIKAASLLGEKCAKEGRRNGLVKCFGFGPSLLQ